MHPAYEIYGASHGPFVFTCEHASCRVPAPLRASPADRAWLGTHWAFDIGAANVTRELARCTASMAVLARFSRLVCDLNRPPKSPEWIRRELQGQLLAFNSTLDRAERERRRRCCHDPYHAAVDRVLSDAGRVLLVAVHSFTPRLGRERRIMEAAVLFDEAHPQLARRLARHLTRAGLRTALNRPYSGRRGMIHSVQHHGSRHGVPYLELELRQDLVCTAPAARALGRRLAVVLQQPKLR